MKYFKHLFSCIGIAIILGFVVGQSFPDVKYYYLNPRFEKKHEITKKLYDNYQFKKSYFNDKETYAKYTLREQKFNVEYSIIYGTLIFGIALLIDGIGLASIIRGVFLEKKNRTSSNEKIADEFAIEFAKWCFKNRDGLVLLSMEEMLDGYKEEQVVIKR